MTAQWKNIGDAPKDGSQYLLRTKDGTVYVGSWRRGTLGEVNQEVYAWRSESGSYSTPLYFTEIPAFSGEYAGAALPTDEDIIRYVGRYGGMCRDCADENGVCPHSGAPCDTDQCRAVIAKTIAALRYGIEHRFIPNIFAAITTPQSKGKPA